MNKKVLASVLLPLVGIVSGVAFAGEPRNPAAFDKIPGQYIVVFNDDVADSDALADNLAKANGLGLIHKYSYAIKGFAAAISAAKLDKIKNDPRVKFVSEDRIVYADGKPENPAPPQPLQTTPTGIQRIGAANLITGNTGKDVGVAVIDTGIDLTHPDLAVAGSYSCVKRVRSANDDYGHGTHVAGTIAALNNGIGVVGVAPQARLYAVKVLDKNGMGSWSDVICGIEWVTKNAAKLNIKVANMSLGGPCGSNVDCGNQSDDPLHQAMRDSRDAGVTYVVSAGNEYNNAALSVPAAYDDSVITVSALADSDGKAGGSGAVTYYGADDTFANFSNYGMPPVDIAAPGVNISSTYMGGSYGTMSGTSMAAPHVSGAAALYIAAHQGALWTVVRDAIIAAGEDAGSTTHSLSSLHPEKVLNVSNF